MRGKMVGTVPLVALAILVGLVLTSGVFSGRASAKSSKPQQGTGDQPETDIQGRVSLADQQSGRSRLGFWRGLRLVGKNDINRLGGDFQMTWYKDCAYVVTKPERPGTPSPSNPEGVAVIDASDPRNPTLVKIIRDPATANIHEGLRANERRGILVVPSLQTAIGLYDISADCRNPVLVKNFDTGVGPPPPDIDVTTVHSGKISPDGNTLYLSHSTMLPERHCLTVIDIADLANPNVLLTYGDAPGETCHDLDLSKDGKRVYLGYRNCPPPLAVNCYIVPGGEPYGGLQIVDTTDIQERRPNPEIRVLSTLFGGQWHTETPARIRGRSYILAGEEGECPRGPGRIVDITDEQHPVEVSKITLEVLQPSNCPLGVLDNTAGDSPLLLRPSHYISVDDPEDASMVAYSWYAAGLRVFNIKDPANPVEIAYYNAPVPVYSPRNYDSFRTYTRFHPETGHLWTGSLVNGFLILEFTRYQATGAGWLADDAGGKLHFAVNVHGTVANPKGEVTLEGKGGKGKGDDVKIHLKRLTYLGAVGAGCGSVPEAANALELRGTGTYNGTHGAHFRVCVQDNGQGKGAAPDRFYLACTAGCPFSTGSRTPDDGIDGGTIEVRER